MLSPSQREVAPLEVALVVIRAPEPVRQRSFERRSHDAQA